MNHKYLTDRNQTWVVIHITQSMNEVINLFNFKLVRLKKTTEDIFQWHSPYKAISLLYCILTLTKYEIFMIYYFLLKLREYCIIINFPAYWYKVAELASFHFSSWNCSKFLRLNTIPSWNIYWQPIHFYLVTFFWKQLTPQPGRYKYT